MGKTPKKAAPGGDERNLYVRRLKATTSSSSKDCDASLTVKQRESDNSNRVKPIGVQKRLPVPVGKVFKSKLRSPSRTKSHHALKNPTRFQPSTSKDEKKLASTTIAKSQQDTAASTMYTETEESAVELKVSITKKEMKETIEKKTTTNETITKGDEENSVSHTNTNGKEIIELTETENSTPRDESPKEKNVETSVEISTIVEISIEKTDNVNESSETIKNEDVIIETERASSESEENSLKLIDEPEQPKILEQNGESLECQTNGHKEDNIEETKEIICEKIEQTTKTTENCSVDVVESTTCETSDSGNVTQSEKDIEITEQPKDSNIINDPSFVSYDSSIMLKDVQIKLNDCLKENSKLFETSNVDETNTAEQNKRLDMSFGKTLRNISGRSTINRLRYVTVRENRFSPNDSLFVNTSSVSLDPEDSTSCKLLRYPTDLSESLYRNGSPAERKRKIAENAASASTKKLKTDTSNILNTSLELIKGIRRPVEVSTPKTKAYKFQSDNLSYKSFNDEKLTIDAEVEPKKWCVIM